MLATSVVLTGANWQIILFNVDVGAGLSIVADDKTYVSTSAN